MKDLIKQNAKGIIGLLTPAVSFVAVKAGLNLDDVQAAGIATAITGVLVWAVPNSYGTGFVPASYGTGKGPHEHPPHPKHP